MSQPAAGFIFTSMDCGVHSTLRSKLAFSSWPTTVMVISPSSRLILGLSRAILSSILAFFDRFYPFWHGFRVKNTTSTAPWRSDNSSPLHSP